MIAIPCIEQLTLFTEKYGSKKYRPAFPLLFQVFQSPRIRAIVAACSSSRPCSKPPRTEKQDRRVGRRRGEKRAPVGNGRNGSSPNIGMSFDV